MNFKSGGDPSPPDFGGPSPPDFWEAFSAEAVSAARDAAGQVHVESAFVEDTAVEVPVGHTVAEGTAVVGIVAEAAAVVDTVGHTVVVGSAVVGIVAEAAAVVDTVVVGTAVIGTVAEGTAKQTTKIRRRKADYASGKAHGVGKARSLTA